MLYSSHELLGFAAAALTTAAFVPQVVKSWTTRDLSGISLSVYGLFTLGAALRLFPGVLPQLADHHRQRHPQGAREACAAPRVDPQMRASGRFYRRG